MALNWLDKTTYAVIETRSRISPSRVALIVADDRSEELREVSYRQLHDDIREMAGRLWAAGVRPGAHVGIWADNSAAWIEAWLGSSHLGAVTVAISPRLTPREVGELIERNNVTQLLVGGRCVPGATALRDAGQAPRAIFSLDDEGELPALPEPTGRYVAAAIDGRRVGLMQFTSGSTGMPKAVRLREGSVATVGACCASRWMLDSSDRLFGVFSLSHNAGSTFTAMAALTAGAALVLTAEGWSAGAGLPLADRCGTTVLPSLDTIIADLLASAVRPARLRLIVGGFDRNAADRMVSELGVEVSNTYGLSEVTASVAVGDLRDPLQTRVERIGRPHPGLFVRIVDEDGQEVPPGAPGELQVDGWAKTVGYYGVSADQQPFTADGWVSTGDLGSLDADGYVSFLGRLKDVIRSGGENVAGFEIERYLESHPDVLQAAVVGAPHERFGEVPFAFVRLRPEASTTAGELAEFCSGQLAVFKIPKRFELVASFPLVGINKISKPELRQRAAELTVAATETARADGDH